MYGLTDIPMYPHNTKLSIMIPHSYHDPADFKGTRQRMPSSYQPLEDMGQPCRCLLEFTRHQINSVRYSTVRRNSP
ncbi:UNVERIFIED_CONTAM: hypothetical protein FKN15_042340 [Acipenser sinensis]